ncbi:hypothetical protein Bca4012_039599 [Brassica carinata]|uniref:Uncharacterized protein n=1 Tax=Brassica carinata TaxID=52824 RepID=A0A8X7WA24_BRACI|nr:hypothetical protein Bca52824_007838 [Brassica carinata]
MEKRISVEEEKNCPLITTKIVEYLQPVMCQELLCKFPDNFAFGFDYTQSSLWSPLLPRNYASPSDLDSDSCVCHNLELGEFQESKKIMKTSMNKKMKKSKLDMSSIKNEDSPGSGCFPVHTKGWDGVLKAASKHFKKSKKKRDPIADVKLLNFCNC